MIATLLPIAAKWWKAGLGLILGFILCWPVASCSGRADGRAEMQQAIDRANVAFLQIKAQADAVAARERVADQQTVTNLERSLSDAVANIPDAVPSARRLARGCAQLRSQGVDTSRLSQCGGPAGTAQAPAAR